ncbi:unnamed protein product [Candida parapsilosis]
MEEKYIGGVIIDLECSSQTRCHTSRLETANVLISKEGNVQLCDFGVAAKVVSNSSKRTTMAGTPYWMAPEVIKSGEATIAKPIYGPWDNSLRDSYR